MLKRLLIFSSLVLAVTQLAAASDREDDVARSQKAAQVFKEIMDTPDKGIPHDLLDKAKCIAIIPGDKKFAFIFGGNYGRGVATCRTAVDGVRRCLWLSKEGAWDIRSEAPPPI